MRSAKSPATLAARGALKTDQLGRQVISEASFQQAFTQGQIYAELSERCHCGSVNAQIYTCVTGHAFLRCAKCGMHRARLSHPTITFVSEIVSKFGRPIAPIKIRAVSEPEKIRKLNPNARRTPCRLLT